MNFGRRVHLIIVNCLIKNKFNIHVIYYMYLSQHYKPNCHAKNIIWLKCTINYSLFKLNYNYNYNHNIFLQIHWLYSCCVPVPKECACVTTNLSAKGATGFLMPDQRYFPSLYSYSLFVTCNCWDRENFKVP